jgi:hypothetical protein
MTVHRIAQFAAVSVVVDGWIVYAVVCLWKAVSH